MSSLPPWNDASPESRAILRGARRPRRMTEQERSRTATRMAKIGVSSAGILLGTFWWKGWALALGLGLSAVVVQQRVAHSRVESHRLVRLPALAPSIEHMHMNPPAPVVPAVEQPIEAAPVEPAVLPPPAHTSTRSTHAATPRDLQHEVDLLQRASAALGHNPRHALDLVDQHQSQYSQGALIAEREFIAVDALTRLGRSAEARRRGNALIARFPGSALVERVRALLRQTH